ncbi:tRNA-dihydrouridine(47) synthase [NAD(P)(+)]-like protein [Tanacetum coccineum]
MSTIDRILKLRIASVDLTIWEGGAYESEGFGVLWMRMGTRGSVSSSVSCALVSIMDLARSFSRSDVDGNVGGQTTMWMGFDEKMKRKLPASSEWWDKMMKRKYSLGIVFTRPADSNGDPKIAVQSKAISEPYVLFSEDNQLILTVYCVVQAAHWALLRRHVSEDLFGVQICRAFPDIIARASELLKQECTVDFINISMGWVSSPFKTNADEKCTVIRAVSSIVDIPVTIKTVMVEEQISLVSNLTYLLINGSTIGALNNIDVSSEYALKLRHEIKEQFVEVSTNRMLSLRRDATEPQNLVTPQATLYSRNTFISRRFSYKNGLDHWRRWKYSSIVRG